MLVVVCVESFPNSSLKKCAPLPLPSVRRHGLLPAFLNGLAVKAKPPQKEATLQIISALAAKAPRAVGNLEIAREGPK